MMNEIQKTEVVTPVNFNEQAERVSIDMQIATAHQYPRDPELFRRKALDLATIDDETAASCLYRRPVGKNRNGEEIYAEGMSVRMAEIVAGCYGNLRVGTRTIESTPRYVVIQGIAHDLESNYLATAECKEATVTRDGRPYDERMRIVIEKAAAAKAKRDAIFSVVPRASVKFIETAVREKLFGGASGIDKWRERIAAWVSRLGIDEKRVWAALGVSGADALQQSEIEKLVGIKSAITSGDVTIDEAFPELARPAIARETLAAKAAAAKQSAAGAGPGTKTGSTDGKDGLL